METEAAANANDNNNMSTMDIDFFDEALLQLLANDDANPSTSHANQNGETYHLHQIKNQQKQKVDATTTTKPIHPHSIVGTVVSCGCETEDCSHSTITTVSTNAMTSSGKKRSREDDDEEQEEEDNERQEDGEEKIVVLTDQQKAIGRRERNREHAKRSRKRKKVYVDTLQQNILKLQQENEKLRSAMTHHFGSRYVEEILTSSMSFSSNAVGSSGMIPSITPTMHQLTYHQGYGGELSLKSISPTFTTATTTSTTDNGGPVVNLSSVSGIKHNVQPTIVTSTATTTTASPNTHQKQKEISVIEHTLNEINNNNIAYKHRLHLLLPRATVCGDLIANPILSDDSL